MEAASVVSAAAVEAAAAAVEAAAAVDAAAELELPQAARLSARTDAPIAANVFFIFLLSFSFFCVEQL